MKLTKSTLGYITLAAFAALANFSDADPLLTSWSTERSGQYCRVYLTKEQAAEGVGLTTWGDQTLPAYTDIQKVEHSDDWVYVNTTGLASHRMGPWYFDEAKTELFNNLPLNLNPTERFPRVPTVPATKSWNYLGSLGRWVNGVQLSNMLDGAFYYNGTESQDGGVGVQTYYWVRNAMAVEVVTFDNTNGHQPGSGDYHYHANPGALRYQLGDNVTYTPNIGDDNNGVYSETPGEKHHSPILAWSFDGFPIYGPYGYDDPDVNATDTTIRRMVSGFVPRDGNNGTDDLTVVGRNSLPKWAAEMRGLTTASSTYLITNTAYRGPAVTDTYVIGYWVEDFAYLGNLGYTQNVDFDLDVYNGRFCRTPEYPNGTYAYFVAQDANDEPAFPYAIGRQYYGDPTGGAVTEITETTTIAALGGPNAATTMESPEVDSNAGTVTLTWNSLEGGSYTLESSPNLNTWTAESGISTVGSETVKSVAMSTTDSQQFYRVTLDSLAEYDETGSEAPAPGGDGGPPGGGGAVAGTGTPATGYVFSFADGPPMQNLISNVVVKNASGSISVTGTVVAYAINGPTGGTVTISFDNSTFTSGYYTAQFTATNPQGATVTQPSSNYYTQP